MQAIQLRYFALLREERGLAAETVETTARTPRDLYQELAGRHGFSLPADRVGVAVNESFAAMDHALAAGDVVVFIPPVAGG
jgi:molybdopterin converting factor subunit 1